MAAAGVAVLSRAVMDNIPVAKTLRNMLRERWGWPANPSSPTHKDLKYAASGGKHLTLDLYLPECGKAPYPLIVFLHGGGFLMGDKTLIEPGAFHLLGKGYAVASIEYSLSGTAKWPTQGHEIKGAVRWLRANAEKYQLDPARFVAFGGSAGGHLASFLGTTNGLAEFDSDAYGNMEYSSNIQACVAWYPPNNFLHRHRFSFNVLLLLGDANKQNPRSALGRLLGGSISKNPELALAASPRGYISPETTVPFLLMHGARDVIIAVEQSVEFNNRMNALGIPCRLVLFEDYLHVDQRFNSRENMETVARFLDRVLSAECRDGL